jgi:hypothetical protein
MQTMRPKLTAARRSALLRAGLGALLAVLPGCLSATPPGAYFATTPPGARVRIDGHDTGFVTPCMIDLDDGGRVGVQLELQGYRTASIVLAPASETTVVGWSHAVAAPWGALRVPIQLPAVDLFLPFRPDAGHHPQRVHVTLRQDNG